MIIIILLICIGVVAFAHYGFMGNHLVTQSDPIIGTWRSSVPTQNYMATMNFNNNGSCTLTSYSAQSSLSQSVSGYWKNVGNYQYNLTLYNPSTNQYGNGIIIYDPHQEVIYPQNSPESVYSRE
jgi:hypothetical protein